MTKLRVQAILLLVPALWGLVFVGVDRVLDELSVFQMVTIRFTFVCVAFAVLFAVSRRNRAGLSRSQWRLVWFAGLMGVPLSQLAIFYAQNFLSPTPASLIITTSPAVAAMLAPATLGERLSRWQILGFVVALVGSAMVIVIGAAEDVAFEVSNVLGAAVGLITPVAWAVYTITLKKLTKTHSALGAVGLTLLVGSVFLLPFAPSAIEGGGEASGAVWLWLLFLAFGGTFIPYLMWFWGLRYLDASQTSAYLYLVPVFALLWSLAILGDVPPIGALAGGVLVLGGVALTQTSPTAAKPVAVTREEP